MSNHRGKDKSKVSGQEAIQYIGFLIKLCLVLLLYCGDFYFYDFSLLQCVGKCLKHLCWPIQYLFATWYILWSWLLHIKISPMSLLLSRNIYCKVVLMQFSSKYSYYLLLIILLFIFYALNYSLLYNSVYFVKRNVPMNIKGSQINCNATALIHPNTRSV